jgi:glycosyltransferase involved in cell wall biosynthesis
MKVALVYDRVNKWGGAERVLLSLHKIFPQADLYTSVYNEETKWAKIFKVHSSFLQNFPFAKKSHEIYPLLMPLAFESFNFEGYDLVISITSEAAKGIITGPETLHVCYLLTPTRYLWSGYQDYFRDPIIRYLTKPLIAYLRNWDLVASKRPDKIIAISTDVKKRIKKYYGIDSEIIFPPIFETEDKEEKKSKRGDYYLVVSRLVYYKRIDLAVKAFTKLGKPLKIVGTGGEIESLKKIAGPNIEFLGYLTDEELSVYYKNCRALVFPGKEDFGLVMAEAQNFGKPVIAFKGGGALDIIIKGKTGELFEKQTEESLSKALKLFESKRYNTNQSRENAKRFLFDNFKKQFLESLDKELNKI